MTNGSLYLLSLASPKFTLQKTVLAAVVEATGKREYRRVPCYTSLFNGYSHNIETILNNMSELIDHKLRQYFQPERLQMAFKQYEAAKQDYFEPSVVQISMGADGISYETFKKELEQRCAFISHRLLLGTYQFYPFREIIVQKPSGGERVLSIATIRDVLVQKLLYEALYDEVESKFSATSQLNRVSFAYRRQKSAPYAATLIHQYIKQGYQFALDADIVKFFDNIPHQKLFKLIE